MRQLNGRYTQVFNRTHRQVGHVFQGRYKCRYCWRKKKDLKEILKKQRYPGRQSLEKIFRRVADKKESIATIENAVQLNIILAKKKILFLMEKYIP